MWKNVVVWFWLCLLLAGCGGGAGSPSSATSPITINSSPASSSATSSPSVMSSSVVAVSSSAPSSSIDSSSSSSNSSALSSFMSSSSSSKSARNISNKLEAEQNDGALGVVFEDNQDGQSAGWIDPDDYIEWRVQIPTTGNYNLKTRSSALAAANLQVKVDGIDIVEIGIENTTGWHIWQEFVSASFPLTAGTHTLRVHFTNALQNLDWVKLQASSANPTEELTTGLWRLVDRSNRLTLTHNPFTGWLTEANYSGHIKQQWRIKDLGNARYEFKLEGNGQCLIPTINNGVTLGACGDSTAYWTLDTLRLRSENRPAIYRLRAPSNNCLEFNLITGPKLSPCETNARWYLEPVGYDERSKPVEYEVRALLIVKPTTNVIGVTQASIPTDIIDAAKTSYEQDVAIWFKRMTDGRVAWKAETVISTDPLSSLTEAGGNYLPAAVNMLTDVARYIPRGKYDTAAVFFNAGNVSGGWGWGPGMSVESNYSLWVTVHGGQTPAWQWISGANEPTEVFIHEPMHGYDAHFDRFGLPLPEGYLHGAEANKYSNESNGWAPWYRDYWLGTVIATDDTYRGYGPRMFRMMTVRDYALSQP